MFELTCVESLMYMNVFLWKLIKTIFAKKKNIIMEVIYRPPGTEMRIFNEIMSSLLNALNNENKYCYLMGDYNINLLNYGKHKETSGFVNLFHSYSFISLINKPTRLAGQNATLIDTIFTNCFNHLRNTSLYRIRRLVK